MNMPEIGKIHEPLKAWFSRVMKKSVEPRPVSRSEAGVARVL